MPISDILAEIQGSDATGTGPATKKRKAAPGDPQPAAGNNRKLVRRSPASGAITSQSGISTRPVMPSAVPSTAAPKPPCLTNTPRLSVGHAAINERHSPVGVKVPAVKPKSRQAPPPESDGKPPASTKTQSTGPRDKGAAPPPKRGSYADLMARASRAQQMKPAGTIQHKPLEKGLSRKEKGEAHVEQTPRARVDVKGRGENTRVTARQRGTGRAQAKQGSGSEKVPAAASAEPEKKIKKTALAATGYQGTARPQQTSAASRKPRGPDGNPSGDHRHRPQRPMEPRGFLPAFSAPKRKRQHQDEQDSDMDDFIVDDDDDDEDNYGRGVRYNYASDGSSDMEAGLDDVWNEEAQASRIAKYEDAAEEALLKRQALEKARRLGK